MTVPNFDPINADDVPVKTGHPAKAIAATVDGARSSSSPLASSQDSGARAGDDESDDGKWKSKQVVILNVPANIVTYRTRQYRLPFDPYRVPI